MITVYWSCSECGAVGKEHVQIFACTPLDPTVEEITAAKVKALDKIKHEHVGRLSLFAG